MKKMTAFVSMLATALLVSAVPAFSAPGAYGPYVPNGGDFGVVQKGESHHVAGVSEGFYGTYVPFDGAFGMKGGGKSERTALSGAYGAYGPYVPKGVSQTTRDNCLLVAMNCPLDIMK